ncbi:hypothetical protein [Mesorhizobium sp. NZP2077]|uniref:hypothetical protein n=1 Tax=Mesorhizobium sp. NZP2077 TaxID=2483404 RepID=UPI00155678B9|nr:hypothetical protein [Mesorhizobium sp. NZP2077]QKC83487.1 hypothetical protein EB232_19410 [Mesorhizobium sp. NZP2077]QKD17004.1 hypothetical protein HGP13_19155 [Mesorhizobium sp. NZP2077]
MKPIIATESEQPELYALVKRERPAIDRAVDRMAKQMRGLSDVSQKVAIAQLTATWSLANYPDDPDLALSLSEAIRHQTDIYLREITKADVRH